MKTFRDFIEEEITEEDIDSLIENLEWADIIDLYENNELIIEDISTAQRIKMGQKTRARKTMLAIARNIKLKKASGTDVIKKRAVVAARKILLKKFLKGRDKKSLSATEKNRLEARISGVLATVKTMPIKLIPKIKELERQRLHNRNSV